MTKSSIDVEVDRIKSLLPANWFGDESSYLDALVYGVASVNNFIRSLIAYLALQTRIKTASDGFLDLIAADYFGSSVLRKLGQSDDSFRNTITANLFRERATRASLAKVIRDITGTEPVIFEPARPKDTGGYGMSFCGYGVAGRYGSLSLPYQSFVTVTRPKFSGIPVVAGYGVPVGAYGTPSKIKYSRLSEISKVASDADIYEAIESVRMAGTIIWVRFI